MPYTIRLKLKEKEEVVRRDVLKALHEEFNNLKSVCYISQIYNKTWFVSFKQDYEIKNLIGKRLTNESMLI